MVAESWIGPLGPTLVPSSTAASVLKNVKLSLENAVPTGILRGRLEIEVRFTSIVPVAFSPTSSVPVASKSTVAVCLSCICTDLSVLASASVESVGPIATDVFISELVVRASMTTVASPAKKIAHTKKAIATTPSPPKMKSFLRKESKLGTLMPLFTRGLNGFAPVIGGAAFGVSSSMFTPSIMSSSGGSVIRAWSPMGRFAPSMMSSSSSTLSAGISASSGLLWRFLAIGILAAAASATRD